MKVVTRTESLNPNQWFSNYYQYLFNYARTRVSDDYTTQELIQETFLSALKSAKNFQNKSTERTWLTSILKYKIIDHYRRNNTYKGVIEREMLSSDEYEAMHFSELPDDSSLCPADNYENDSKSIKQCVLDSLEKLPKQQSKVFKMKMIDNVENDTICKSLNISINNLWVLMYRAKRSLAVQLEPKVQYIQ